MEPGSNQYSGVTPLQLLRAFAALPAAGAYDTPIEIPCPGMGRLTLFAEYTRGAAGGAADFLLEASPFSTGSFPGAPLTEWYPLSILELASVTAGADAAALLQRDIVTYTSIDATRDGITLDFSLPSYAERVRISVRESGVAGTPGSLGMYATLSITDGSGEGLMRSVQGDISAIIVDPLPISSDGITIAQTPTITAGAYIAGDTVGGLLTFANAARVTGGGGVIKDIKLIDDAGQDVELELWLFNQAFTPVADNAPWAPTEADLENWIATITISTYFAAGTPSVANPTASHRYDLIGTSLFGQLVTRGAPTYVATDDLTIKVGLLED